MIERDGYPAESRAGSTRRSLDPDAAELLQQPVRMGVRGPDAARLAGRYLVASCTVATSRRSARSRRTRRRMPVWNMYIAVDSADDAGEGDRIRWERASPSPSTCSTPVAWRFADRENAVFRVWEATDQGCQLVNEPNTWNFSELNTRNIDGAKAYYGALSAGRRGQSRAAGWSSACSSRPGTGSSSRRATRDSPATGGQRSARVRRRGVGYTRRPVSADVPPHWSVTFAMDDADASAAKVTELGGEVLVPPFDAGPTGSRR